MYKIIIIISIALFFISLIILFKCINIIKKINKNKKEYFDEKKSREKKSLDKIIKEKENAIKEFEEQYNSCQKIIEQETANKNLILYQKTEIIDKELDIYKIQKEQVLKEQLENFKLELKEEEEKAKQELEIILNDLEEHRKMRATINEAILREKEIQEKEIFYKLNVSEYDIEDIEVLKTIEPKLRNKEALNKLIFDVFIKKPMDEMIKRVLIGKEPSGIYKITYIPTGESYIGKSTNIKKRWQEHIRSSYNLGTIAHSSLHTKMARDGVWNFTFELLEETSKEKLGEREKYWIDFYDTKKTGLNERAGG